jgi:MYXO-CTERM domain-containing protein
LRVGVGPNAGNQLSAYLTGRAAELELEGALQSGLQLHVSSRPTSGGDGLRIMEVRGSFGPVPLSKPVARALVDTRDRGRVLLLSMAGGLGTLRSNDLSPSWSARRALEHLRASGLPGSAHAYDAELVVVSESRQTHLAWRMDPPFDPATTTNPVFLVDAHTGSIAIDHDQVDFAQVRAFPEDPLVTPNAELFDLIDLDQDATTLTGPYFEAYNCLATGEPSCTLTQTAAADVNGDFLYPAPDIDNVNEAEDPDDEFAETSVYYHADRFHDYLINDLGSPALPCNAQNQKNTLVANYHLFNNAGTAFKWGNAAHTGDCEQTFLFGQTDNADYAYEGDVAYHEVFHAVTSGQMGVDRELRSVRMLPEAVVLDARNVNEALSDLFSCTFTDDPDYSQYLAQYYWAYVPRTLDNAYSCPNSLTGSRHQDSEFFSAALWDAHDSLGAPMLTAVIDAIAMFNEDTTYDEAASTIVAIVDAELGPEAAATLQSSFESRGLFDRCERVVPHDMLERDRMFVYQPFNTDTFNWEPIRPPSYQISFAFPDDADTVSFSFQMEDSWGDDFALAMLTKEGSPIGFTYEVAEQTVTVSGDSTGMVGQLNAGGGSFTGTPGETSYTAFYNTGTDRVAINTLQVEFSCTNPDGCMPPSEDDTGGTGDTDTGGTGEDDETGDAGADGGDGADKGCGCRTQGTPANAAWLLLLAALRRRRS